MKGNSYLPRKLHSLLGVIPLGLFIAEHAVTNYSAFEGGQEGFTDAIDLLNSLPLMIWMELFIIWLPILFHGIYGLYIAYQSNLNTGRFSYGRNWAFALQRITGVITFVFVAWHFYDTRIQVALGNVAHEDLGQHMNNIFSNPVAVTAYVIGVLAATFHFANGLWAFLVSWGITVGPRAQKISSRICMGIFVILAVMFLLSIFALRGDEFAASAATALSAVSLG